MARVASLLLARRGVACVVVERRRGTLRAPAAHVLRRAPMAVLDRIGVGPAVRRVGASLPLEFVTGCVTLGGPEVGRLALRPPDPWTGERPDAPWTSCPQGRLEPILSRHALRRPAIRMARGAECLELAPERGAVSGRPGSGIGRARSSGS